MQKSVSNCPMFCFLFCKCALRVQFCISYFTSILCLCMCDSTQTSIQVPPPPVGLQVSFFPLYTHSYLLQSLLVLGSGQAGISRCCMPAIYPIPQANSQGVGCGSVPSGQLSQCEGSTLLVRISSGLLPLATNGEQVKNCASLASISSV